MPTSGENFGSAFEQGIGEFENSATVPSSSGYLIGQQETSSVDEEKRKERMLDLIQSLPKPIIGLSRFDNTISGIATRSDPKTEIMDGSGQQEITDAAEHFISRQKKPVRYRTEILEVADRVSQCLDKQGIDAGVNIDLFTDPEYSDWMEIKIRIAVRKDQLQKVYDAYESILEFAFAGISQKTLRKLSVTID